MMPSMNRCESGCSSWLKLFGFDRLHRCISSINLYYQTYVCMCMYDVYWFNWYRVSEKSHWYVQLQTWFRIWWFKRREPLQILCFRPSWALRHICRSPVHHFTWDFNAHFCSWKLQYLSILDVPKATIYQIYILGVIRVHVLWWKWNSDTGLGLEHQIYQVANQVQLRGHLVVICHENSKV